MSDTVDDAKSRWITRVLGITIPVANGADGADSGAPRPRGPVAYGQLLLDWRAAQSKAAANITGLGQTILARRDVQADPRFAQVQAAVAAMPSLLPAFGAELEDLIDAAMTAGAGPAADAALDKARDVAKRYRAALDEALTLERLEALAARHLAVQPPIYSALDAALAALEGEFAARMA